jgi:hypothetical protein
MEFWLAQVKRVRVVMAEPLAKATCPVERHPVAESLLAQAKQAQQWPAVPGWQSVPLALAFAAPTGQLLIP